MADLNGLQASETIKIAGADSSGNETNFANVSVNGEIKAIDILNVSVAQALLTVNATGTPVEVKAGSSRLANRKSVMIQAQGTNVVYGFASDVQQFLLPNGATVTLSVGDNVGVWIDRTSNGDVKVAIAEFA